MKTGFHEPIHRLIVCYLAEKLVVEVPHVYHENGCREEDQKNIFVKGFDSQLSVPSIMTILQIIPRKEIGDPGKRDYPMRAGK